MVLSKETYKSTVCGSQQDCMLDSARLISSQIIYFYNRLLGSSFHPTFPCQPSCPPSFRTLLYFTVLIILLALHRCFLYLNHLWSWPPPPIIRSFIPTFPCQPTYPPISWSSPSIIWSFYHNLSWQQPVIPSLDPLLESSEPFTPTLPCQPSLDLSTYSNHQTLVPHPVLHLFATRSILTWHYTFLNALKIYIFLDLQHIFNPPSHTFLSLLASYHIVLTQDGYLSYCKD